MTQKQKLADDFRKGDRDFGAYVGKNVDQKMRKKKGCEWIRDSELGEYTYGYFHDSP